MFRRFYERVGVCMFEAMYICVNACAKTCTCIYLNIACYHPYSTRLFYMPSSHFLCPSPLHVLFLCFFFHSAHFVCPFCLSVSVEYCCFAFAIAATAATVMLGSHEQVGSRQGDSRGQEEGGEHSISVIDIAALCILSIAYQSLVYHSSS